MTTVKVNGAVVNMKWAYGRFGYPGLQPNETLCDVTLEVNGEVKKGSGLAFKTENDHFCKEEGRKYSLRRAIADFTRPERTLVYQAYRGRK